MRASRALLSSASKVASCEEALRHVQSNFTLLCGGFGLSGVPDTLINHLHSRPEIKGITAVSNNAGIDGKGLAKLLETGQISKMVSSYIGGNKTFEQLYLTGKLDLELNPQGTLAERVRAGAAGIPAFYTPAGYGTWLQEGKLPVRYDSEGNPVVFNEPREARNFDGTNYVMERAIKGDVAFVKAYKADTMGNCWFKGSARNFNSVFGRNATYTVVEAENIVEPGEIEAENVHLPGIYVHKVVQSNTPKEIEIYKNSEETPKVVNPDDKRTKIVKRVAREFQDGDFANLGIGIPTLIPGHLPEGLRIEFQSENGVLGVGPYPQKGQEDPDLINAGKETITLNPGASLFGSEESFGMIRSGKINIAVLGALQVSKYGDLANWGLPGRIKGMGGAMDLVANPAKTKVIIAMEHVDKKGRPRILDECNFPLTGVKCVWKIVTDLAVFDVSPTNGLTLTELADGVTVEEIKQKTPTDFAVSPDLVENSY